MTHKWDMLNPMNPDDHVSAGVLGGDIKDDEEEPQAKEETHVLKRIASIGTEYTTDHV